MALNIKYCAPFVLILVIGFKDVLCVDSNASNPWNRNQPASSPLESPLSNTPGKSTTTPWPELGQRGRPRDEPKPIPEGNRNWGPPNPQNSRRDYVAGPRPIGTSTTAKPSLGPDRNQPASDNQSPNPAWVQPGGALKRDYVANKNQANNNFLTAERATTGKTAVTQPPTPSNKRDFVANPGPNVNKPPGVNGPPAVQPTTPNAPASNKRDFVANPKPAGINGVSVVQPTASAGNKIPGPTTPKNPVSFIGDTSSSKPTQQTLGGNKLQEDDELREWSEALVKKDTNNPLKHVTINYQGMTRSGSLRDEAPQPLLVISEEAYKFPSVSKLILLYNNYILESHMNEVYTAQEKIEENNFLDTILPTPVMQHARNFLVQKGKISKDPKAFRDLLKTIWFNMYSRGGGKIGSSGFEHVFLAEIKNNTVSGLHNWLYFKEEEQKNLANYLGYMKKIEFEKGAIIKYHFNFHNIDKPVGSMFVGTSPEFEIALYSTCFIMRPDAVCPLRVGGKNFIIRTYTYRYRGKNMIGSAFPEI